MATKYEAKRLRRHFIKEWLAELGVSQTELADLMETDKVNVTRWIKEPWRITLDVLSGVADALLPKAPEMRDAGNLLRDPKIVLAARNARRAAEQFLETLPDPRTRN
jgi:Cro/C1-type helix-turn-helix DNA-binding protein